MTRKRKPQSFSNLLSKNTLQYDLHQKALQIKRLNSLLQTYLKKHNIDECRVGNSTNGRLLIETANAAWRTRLSFMRMDLISFFRQYEPSITSLKIEVNPALHLVKNSHKAQKTPPKQKISVMPEDVASSFRALGETLDPDFQKILQSLAQNTEAKKGKKR
ncbi:MAG TPA: DUF721 domain-containing protein [Psychromonas hadalis]|nr:DUF721 domain-containing protein [Psychromonas hadalis]